MSLFLVQLVMEEKEILVIPVMALAQTDVTLVTVEVKIDVLLVVVHLRLCAGHDLVLGEKQSIVMVKAIQ